MTTSEGKSKELANGNIYIDNLGNISEYFRIYDGRVSHTYEWKINSVK